METFKWITGIIVSVVVSCWLLISGLNYIERRQCNSIRYSGIETQYRGMLDGGCFIKVNDRFIPKENWRGEYEN